MDWEMSTIGDPLLDLGWLLATWRQDDGSSVFSHTLTGMDGLASPMTWCSATPRAAPAI